MTDVYVTLGGRVARWKSVRISRAIDAFVGSVSVTLPLTAEVPLTPGDRIQVVASGSDGGEPDTLLVGFVDSIRATGDAKSAELQIEARDRTADLVDGTRVQDEIEGNLAWHRSNLYQIASDIARPFGLRVLDEVGAAGMAISNHLGQPGETAHAILERAARLHGVLLSTSPAGSIVLGYPRGGRVSEPLHTGRNGRLRSWALTNDASKRYHRYNVRSQTGLEGLATGAAAFPDATVIDDQIRTQRETVIIAQGTLVGDECTALARWHATVNRARSVALTAEVTGWRSVHRGPVWRPGMQVAVRVPDIGLEGMLLVAGVDLALTDNGELATLRLVRPDAYEVDPSEAIRLAQNLGSLL